MSPRAAPAFGPLGALIALIAAWPALFLLGCQSASLEDRSCPCDAAQGYICCEALQICMSPSESCVDLGPWPASLPLTPDGPPPVPMDDLTVFAFSQVDFSGLGPDNASGMNPTGGSDPQVLALQPDMVIRGWGQWGDDGTSPSPYDANANRDGVDNSYVNLCHQASPKILFMGGGTATALISKNAAPPAGTFDPFATCDASGQEIRHDQLNAGEYRGSLANPAYRKHLVDLGTIQIEAGVDGLQYTEVNADFQGAMINSNGAGDGNEGFDDYHLADFNAFLLAKYPMNDYSGLWGMTADNMLHADRPAGDLVNNFNYRTYLQTMSFAANPTSSLNPLAMEWGTTMPGQPTFGATTFVDTAEPYRYWKDIVTQLRSAALSRQLNRFYISANGLFPYVDFISWGIYDSDPIMQTLFTFSTENAVLQLDFSFSAKAAFVDYRKAAALVAPGAPVVVYLDGTWNDYHNLPVIQRRDFWRVYAAEAYANGLFFAFLLHAPPSGANVNHSSVTPNTAVVDGTMPLFQTLASFYRGHASLYHGAMPSPSGEAGVSIIGADPNLPPKVSVAVADQAVDSASGRPRRFVHLVSHAYDVNNIPAGSDIHSLLTVTGLSPQNISVTVPVTAVPNTVSLASPDWDDQPLSFVPSSDGTTITVDLPNPLMAYDVIVISY